jgi:hypothetical protein
VAGAAERCSGCWSGLPGPAERSSITSSRWRAQSKLAERSPARERISLLGLDFEKQQIPREHDVILLSRVLMGMSPERARSLVGRCAEALSPSGALVVHEFDAATRVGALLSLDMLLHTGGAAHPRAELEDWLSGFGLELESARRVLPYTRAWIARKAG